ncbi:Gfo/Idh/MocA family oxidoreductase [Pseudoflavitalea sp. X16]|uniref:Gfo/Idh/MocA family protein n=1 Tax=Paraflavitalea devenefica TaxID=2716334 RepID=UPI00141EA0D1|nr:Gfo/Idh/MocA family oxidoreductase [Paraflavitalea devenefica]NII24314.1 Gfo/Idh/MocA family oxidoreductase [Paraflavitalea devenefica]
MAHNLSRLEFLQRTAMAGVGLLLSSLEGFALTHPQKKIKIAVIGCGSVSGQYLPHLSKSPYVELVSTCDIIPQRAIDRATEFKVPNHYPHIDKLLAGAPFDLMVNLTDMQEHGRLNKQALDAGKHVWSEKPMANTYKEGKALFDLAQSKKLRIWGAPAVVNSPQFAFMSKAIQDGRLGKVAAAHAHYGHLGPTWSAFFYEKGGGSLPDLGVYNLATLTGLLGPARSVVAMTSIITPERTVDNKGKIKVEAEDNAMVIMDHGQGTLSHVQCGFNYFDPYGHEGKGQDKPTITIWGTKGNMGLVGYDWAPFGVDLAESFTEPPKRHVPDPGTYVWQQGASVVAEALSTNIEPRIAAEHALHVLEIIEAARASAAGGKKIPLQSTFKWPMV